MNVALFGGTFDPPHRGHLAIAEAAADAFRLDKVLFAPAGRQPLKLGGGASPFADRLAMVELTCALDARFAVSEVDAPHTDGSPNYTVDALQTLRRALPQGNRLFNLVGADSFLDLRRWREPERLLELADWIVVSRPGFPLESLDALELTSEQRGRVHLLNGVHEDVSATGLRERLETGVCCTDVLPERVAEYIESHGLYQRH
ncbi:MAG: nicotinate-nucleotide adenylyltransferase [Acidobacteriota bacterium]|nr:nicotinate-nucleotide adenylyltransferase [Acidobacteriota bacterium]